jgi:hypothetical protein
MGPAVLEEALRDIFLRENCFALTLIHSACWVLEEGSIMPISSVIFPILLGLPSLAQLYIPTPLCL